MCCASFWSSRSQCFPGRWYVTHGASGTRRRSASQHSFMPSAAKCWYPTERSCSTIATAKSIQPGPELNAQSMSCGSCGVGWGGRWCVKRTARGGRGAYGVRRLRSEAGRASPLWATELRSSASPSSVEASTMPLRRGPPPVEEGWNQGLDSKGRRPWPRFRWISCCCGGAHGV